VKRTRLALFLTMASITLAGTAACSSGSGTASPAASTTTAPSAAASGAAPARYSPQPWSLPSPSTTDQTKPIWCSALTQVIAATTPGSETDGVLQKRLDALATYRQLWDQAEQQTYVTRQEAEVNRIYLDGYMEITQLKLAHKPANAPEMAKVIEGMNKLTTDSQSLFDSSAAKITELCQLTYGTAAPTTASQGASASPAAS
jgi:hypothetical protein